MKKYQKLINAGLFTTAVLFATWGLNKLIFLYDKNNVTLNGELNISSTDDVVKKFKSMNFKTEIRRQAMI